MPQPELKLQQDCYRLFHNTYPNLRNILWRTENERKRSRYEQMIAKSTGLTAGVSDLCMIYQGTFYAIELKVGNGKQSPAQKEWQKAVEDQGGVYVIIRSLEKFEKLMQNIIEQ